MRAVVQRVTSARVSPGGAIGHGLCVLLGIARDDDGAAAERLAGKVARLRIFENEDGQPRSLAPGRGGSALVVSQFTLIADSAEGNRPELLEGGAAGSRRAGLRAVLPGARGLGVPVETRSVRREDGRGARERRPGHDRARLAAGQLTLVVRGVEVAERPGDETVLAKRPRLVPLNRTGWPVPPGPVFVPANVQR